MYVWLPSEGLRPLRCFSLLERTPAAAPVTMEDSASSRLEGDDRISMSAGEVGKGYEWTRGLDGRELFVLPDPLLACGMEGGINFTLSGLWSREVAALDVAELLPLSLRNAFLQPFLGRPLGAICSSPDISEFSESSSGIRRTIVSCERERCKGGKGPLAFLFKGLGIVLWILIGARTLGVIGGDDESREPI